MAENDTTGWQTPGGPGLKCSKGGVMKVYGFIVPREGMALRKDNHGG
jgi:hypothetical protein